MFLGDLSMSANYSEEESFGLSGTSPRNRDSKVKYDKSPLLSNKEKFKLSLEGDGNKKGGFKDAGKTVSVDSTNSDSPSSDIKSTTAWETLVLFAINFKKLNVHMNMGNVMGNVM